MKRRRALIGAISRAWDRGRRAAKSGDYHRSDPEEFYHLGRAFELRRMRERGEHPQCEMALDYGQNALTQGSETG